MSARVSLEIKGVVKAFPAERAQVSLHLAVAFQVSVEEPLEMEGFVTDTAGESVRLLTC